MRVESVEVFPIRIKASEDLRGGTFAYSHYQTVVVRLSCDGVVGWGEAMTRSDPEATALLTKFLARGIVGEEFVSVSDAWERIWNGLRIRGHTRGVDVEALSGIETALQDCMGKIGGKSLSGMFSKAPAKSVEVYAGSIFESRGGLGKQVAEARGLGMKGCKVKVGFGAEKDQAILKAIRKEWQDGMLVADANGAYDAAGALKACKAFNALDLAWFEEPVPSDDWEAYGRLKSSGVRIGGGESWFVSDYDWALRQGLVGVVEPSVSRCGGVGTEMKVASAAARMKIGFSPMTGMNSCISLAASLHAASAFPSLGVEFNPFTNPLQTELAEGIGPPRDGKIAVPVGPGLGIEINARFVKKHSLTTR